MTIDPIRWYPVASSDDLPAGHVYQTMLGYRPLAIWRASDGSVNIWEDRCPHRGVRFSIGIVRDDELRCRYHAWRFASGSGACTHIPAQPDRRPPAAIAATVWPVAERGGLVWTRVSSDDAPPPPPAGTGVVLRAIPVNRGAVATEAALAATAIVPVRFVVQPVTDDRSVIRGVATEATPADLRRFDHALDRLRRMLEADAGC